jgi:hypothetical protein
LRSIKKEEVRGGLGHLFDLGDLKEWREGCLDGSLGLRGQFFESFSAMRAVLKVSSGRFLDKPFSTVPAFYDRCNAHIV